MILNSNTSKTMLQQLHEAEQTVELDPTVVGNELPLGEKVPVTTEDEVDGTLKDSTLKDSTALQGAFDGTRNHNSGEM